MISNKQSNLSIRSPLQMGKEMKKNYIKEKPKHLPTRIEWFLKESLSL